MIIVHVTVPSPIGELALCASAEGLVAIRFPGEAALGEPAPPGHPLLARAARELAEWFRGERRAFTLPLAPAGTPFQRAVWTALDALPYGTTCSYAELARRIGRPGAARAVGAANGANPLPIVVPCHRVIGAGGALTGYAGGLAAKRWLLEHERRNAPPTSTHTPEGASAPPRRAGTLGA